MTRGRSERLPDVRVAAESDADLLAAFRCATGPWFEQDVEDYIQRHALRRALGTGGNYRLLLVLDDGRLVACAAHHLEALIREDGTAIMATRLQLLAIAVTDQGRRFHDGTRLSDLVMSTLIADALELDPLGTVLTAIVAQDNLRSMAMCERHGLRSQVRYDARHVRISGRFVRTSD